MATQNSTLPHSATPSGAPKLSRYMQRIEAKRLRRLNPSPLTKRARARRCDAQHIITKRTFAADDAVKGAR